MKPNPARIVFRVALVFAAVLAVALVRVVKSIDVDRYRAEASAWTRQATGRELAFAGPVKLRLSLHPALTANGLTLANRPGDARADMVRLDRVEAQIGLLPLLWGEVRVSRVLVDGADILLDENGAGRGNWELDPAAPAAGEKSDPHPAAIRVTQLVFRHVAVHLQDPADDGLTIERATFDTDGLATPIALTLDGKWHGKHLAVTGLLGSLKEVFVEEKPLSLRLKALMPGLVASADGTVKSAGQGLDLALSMTADLNDSADLDPLIGLPLPSLGSARAAFTVSGRLSRPSLSAVEATVGRHDTLAITVRGQVSDPLSGTGIDLALGIDGDASAAFGFGSPGKPLPMALSGHVGASGDGDGRSWRVADLKGTLGRSDVTGRVEVSRHNGHAVIDGQFDSALLDLTRPPQPASTETGHVLPLDGRLFSDDPLPTHILMSSDGHLVWRVARLVDRRMSAGGVTLDLDWHEGKLTAQGGAASIGNGRVDGTLSLDARVSPPATSVDLSLSHVELGALMAQLGLSDGLQGARVDLKLKSTGTGESLRALVATQQGSSLLSIGPTQVASRFTDDGFGAILGRLGGGSGPWTDMRCLVSHFTLADGLARSEALLFSVGTQTVTGQGSVNLASESLDFTLTPRPAGQTPAVQIDLGGTLLHPSVAPARAAYVKNVPGMVSDAASPLMTFASDGNPCFAALAQGRRATRPVPGGLR
jgi:uncharacterized protein involved in outer membrane biogenesis